MSVVSVGLFVLAASAAYVCYLVATQEDARQVAIVGGAIALVLTAICFML